MIEFADREQLKVLCDIAEKILRGRIIIHRVHRQKLKDYKRVIRSLASHRINIERKRNTLLAFHELIPLLIRSIMHLLDEM